MNASSGLRLVVAASLLATLTGWSQTIGTATIRLNTVGYLPGEAKIASIPQVCSNFFVVRASDGVVVYSNTATGPVLNADTAEQLWQADFSAVQAAGKYWLESPGAGRSPAFIIAPDVYQEPFGWRSAVSTYGVAAQR